MKEKGLTLSDGRSGNMKFKDFFSKENFLPSTFDKKQRIQSLVISIALIVFFIFTSLTFFNMLYSFADILGSIVSGSPDVAGKDFLRSLPLFASFFMSLWTVLLLQSLFKSKDEETRMRAVFKKGIVVLSMAGFNILYVVIMRLAGKYSSLIEGSPSYLYPLDSVLYSLLYVVIGLGAILYAKRFKEKLPYTVPVRPVAPMPNKGIRILYNVGVVFWTLIALFGLTGGIMTLCIYDFRHEWAFFGIAVVLVYLLSPVLLGFWQFYFHELKEEKKKEFFLPLSIVSTCVSVLFVVLYFVSLATNKDAPANAGFGMFPITFTATANYGTLVVVITPLVVSIIALVRAIIARFKK